MKVQLTAPLALFASLYCLTLGCGAHSGSPTDARSYDAGLASDGAFALPDLATVEMDSPANLPSDTGSERTSTDPADIAIADTSDGPAIDHSGSTEAATSCDPAGCDDDNACTDNDRCVAGICVGTPRVSTPSVLGLAHAFGSAPALETVVAFPSANRAIFLTRNQLTLAAIQGDSLEALDAVEWGSYVHSVQASPTIWVQRPGTFILPMSDSRVVVIGSNWSIDLYSIAQDRLHLSARFGFGSGGQDMVAGATVKGNSVWTCVGNWIQRYALDGAGTSWKQSPGFTLPGTHNCYALALSPDGQLLAATSSGLDVVDISKDDGTGVLLKTVETGKFVLDVVSSGKIIGLYELTDTAGAAGNVIALDATSLTALATFAQDGLTYPVGATVTSSGLLLEKWDEQSCRQVSVELHPLAGGNTGATGNFMAMGACRGHFGLPPMVIAGAGQLVDVPPTHQVLRIDAATGTMKPLRGKAQGSFAQVHSAGPNLIEALGPYSTHLVDISQPQNPVVRDGGLLVPMNSDWLRAEIAPDGTATLLTIADETLTASGPRLSLYWRQAGTLPTVAGSLKIQDTLGEWAAAGKFLYQVATEGTGDFHVRRYATASLSRAEDQQPKPDLDQTLPGQPLPAGGLRRGLWLAAAAATDDLVVAENRMNAGKASTLLVRYSLAGGSYRAAPVRAADSGYAIDLGVNRQGDAVLLFSDRVLLIDREGKTRASYQHPSGSLSRLLDADQILIAATLQDANLRITQGVLDLSSSDLKEVARYTLPEPVLSATTAGNVLVFGMASALAVAAPYCASP
jgi:hypothetical protein